MNFAHNDHPWQHLPSIRFGFPYYDQKLTEETSHQDPEPKGYVVGDYSFDQKVFTKLRKQAEF